MIAAKGYRGRSRISRKMKTAKNSCKKLGKEHSYHIFGGQLAGLVTEIGKQKIQIAFDDDAHGNILLSALKWAQSKKPADILKTGDGAGW